jgi:hypothetical protein
MKSKATYCTSIPALLLLCIYLLNPLKLYLPYIEYQANYKFISEFLCENKDKPQMHCNGKCYLAKALKSNEEKSSGHQKLIPKNFFSDEMISEVLIFHKTDQEIKLSFPVYHCSISYSYTDQNTPPPKKSRT